MGKYSYKGKTGYVIQYMPAHVYILSYNTYIHYTHTCDSTTGHGTGGALIDIIDYIINLGGVCLEEVSHCCSPLLLLHVAATIHANLIWGN